MVKRIQDKAAERSFRRIQVGLEWKKSWEG